jgi:hypothetical protein
MPLSLCYLRVPDGVTTKMPLAVSSEPAADPAHGAGTDSASGHGHLGRLHGMTVKDSTESELGVSSGSESGGTFSQDLLGYNLNVRMTFTTFPGPT